MKRGIIFSNALMISSEMKLLKKEQVLRLADASCVEEAIKMLFDYGYAHSENLDIDAFISLQLNKLFQLIFDSVDEGAFRDFLLNPYVFNNAKFYFKSAFLGENSISQSALFQLDDEKIKQGIEEKNYLSLPKKMKECCERLSKMEQTSDFGRKIDIEFSKAIFASNLALAKKTRNKDVISYAKKEIDLSNFVTFLRARKLGRPFAYFEEMFLQGGKIQKEVFEASYDLDESKIKVLFEDKYEIIPDILAGKISMDLGIDIVLKDMDLLRTFDATTSTPILSYFKRQTIEFRIVKLILTFVKNDMKKEICFYLRGLYD